eukprot:CAMPEP_0174278180 /NCGR_PEP_ID=MMETSP0439-20130205/61335_1 /TAXON_ID=0 /ORGANISM="Stereomyxa ramosa, Strain Chinc5" /LENGTH=144 /DNA_ID=CAMNT_0015370565 /DNA_START=805 /DNA_END=1239 /DNA_ORIENTATION=+
MLTSKATLVFLVCSFCLSLGLQTCNDNAVGALVELAITEFKFTFWVNGTSPTAKQFIADSQALLAANKSGNVIFEKIVRGPGCDSQWDFHPDPEDTIMWSDLSVEVCDGTPEEVNSNLPYWLGVLGYWCPWNTLVTNITFTPLR